MGAPELKDKIQRILTDKLGSVKIDRDGDIVLENDSAIGFVSVRELGPDTTVVKVASPVLRDVELTPALYEWVATEGQNRLFAHYRVVFPKNGAAMLMLEHDLLGDSLDPDELLFAVFSVMTGANDSDEELQSRFGGRRAAD